MPTTSTTAEACGTNANGHRYVRRGTEFVWLHPADMRDGDEDCSDMSDAEFEACVADASAVSHADVIESSGKELLREFRNLLAD